MDHEFSLSVANLSPEERAKHMADVRRECVEFRQSTNREEVWRDIWIYFRNLRDTTSPYKNQLVSTYLWSTLHSWMSVLEPMFFVNDPVFDLKTARDEDDSGNKLLEKLLTQQVQWQTQFRHNWSMALMESLAFGASYPWTNFRSESKLVEMREPRLSGGVPMLGSDGQLVQDRAFRPVRTFHGPELRAADLWDSFIHPDSRRGFTLVDLTGYQLLRLSDGKFPRYRRDKVMLVLKAAARWLSASKASTGASRNAEYDFIPGDDSLIERDFLALEAGTQSGNRLDTYIKGYARDALSLKLPILHYDDGDMMGAYALNKDGSMVELDFSPVSAPDGEGHRMSIVPHSSPKEVYGPPIADIALPMLKAHSRFLQLSMDGAELTVNPQWLVSELYAQTIGDFYTGPGVINIAPMGQPLSEAIVRQDMPQSWAQALQYREGALQSELDQLFAQDDYARGRLSSGRRTASELSIASEFNTGRLQLLADRISNQFAAPLGRKWLCFDSLYLTQQDLVESLGFRATGLSIPNPEQIMRMMNVVFKGSVAASNQQVMLTRYAQLAGPYMSALPMFILPHVQEFFRGWFSAAGLEGVAKNFPPADPRMATALQAEMAMAAIQSNKGGEGGAQQPSSPTNLIDLMRGQGGLVGGANAMQAPPGTGEYAAGQ